MDFLHFDYTLLIRLVVAVLCGGIIGWERGGTNHEAGLRTHIIVCLGAASIMVVSECIVKQYDITDQVLRMGAQIVSGIGFLGAGSIITDGNRIRGITTAAGLWTTACVGIIIGSGYYIIGIVVVILMFSAMVGLRSMTTRLRERSATQYILRLETKDKECLKNAIHKMLEMDIIIHSLKTTQEDGTETEEAEMEITPPQNVTVAMLMSEIGCMDGIVQFTAV